MADHLASELQLTWQGQLTDLVTALAWSPSGDSWAASSANGEIVWMRLNSSTIAENFAEMVTLQAANGTSIDRLAFSADGCWLAAGGQAGQLSLWAQKSNLPPQRVHTIELHTWIDDLAWHPTLPQLAIAHGPHVKIWDAVAAREMITWRFDRSSIFDLAWHPNGNYLAVAGYKGVEIWAAGDLTTPIQRLNVDTATIQIAWSANGNYLAAGNLDGSLTILDWHNPGDPWILQGCPGKIRQIVWQGTMSHCAVATGAAVVLWNLIGDHWAGQLLEGHHGVVVAIAACPDREMFGSVATDGYLCIWSAQGEITKISTNSLCEFTALAWQPQGLYLATGNQLGEIGVWPISA